MIGNVVENNEILYDGRTNFNVKHYEILIVLVTVIIKNLISLSHIEPRIITPKREMLVVI